MGQVTKDLGQFNASIEAFLQHLGEVSQQSIDASEYVHVLEIHDSPRLLLPALGAFGERYLTVRNFASSLSQLVRLHCFQSEEQSEVLSDPALGFHFHCGLDTKSFAVDYACSGASIGAGFEFDFPQQIRGVSMRFLPETSQSSQYSAFLSSLNSHRLSTQEPEAYRCQQSGAPCLCEHCQESAHERGKHIRRHALSKMIRYSLFEEELPLYARVENAQAGLCSHFTESAELSYGSISHGILGISEQDKRLQIDFRVVHGLRLKKVFIEGEPTSQLEAYDLKGDRSLTLTQSGLQALNAWKHICEQTGSLVSAYHFLPHSPLSFLSP